MELYENEQKQETAVLVSVDTGEFDVDSSLLELAELTKTAGAEVIGEITQKREAPDSATYIGKGKLEELSEFCEANEPDLIIVDGGIGQINVARSVISSLNLNIPVVGLKKDDKHSTEALLAFEPIEEVKINKRSNLFYMLERMQDEVHEFTINYHKQIRSKGSLASILDNVDGIGEKRRKELLKKYKTINKIKDTNIEELEVILPRNVAINLLEFLNEYIK